MSGSQAQSCLLTVCTVEDGSSCIPNTTITRNGGSLTFTEEVNDLPPGMYTIRQVTEVERDGEVTVVRGIALREVYVTSAPTMSAATPTGGVSSPRAIAGG